MTDTATQLDLDRTLRELRAVGGGAIFYSPHLDVAALEERTQRAFAGVPVHVVRDDGAREALRTLESLTGASPACVVVEAKGPLSSEVAQVIRRLQDPESSQVCVVIAARVAEPALLGNAIVSQFGLFFGL